MHEKDYIHNGYEGDPQNANLRFDMNNGRWEAIYINNNQYFVVAIFEDKAGGTWEQEWKHLKSYCGVVGSIHCRRTLRNGLHQIMRTGGKPYDLNTWMRKNFTGAGAIKK